VSGVAEEIPSREVWSRHGATAGRGFHYQDAVGAWLAVQGLMHSGTGNRIVPEGFEDIHVEGAEPLYVQVKSRQEQVGDFGVGKVVSFVKEMWDKRVRRLEEGVPDGRLLLVLERPVAGDRVNAWREPLANLNPEHGLRVGLAKVFNEGDLEVVLNISSILVLGWEEASDGVIDVVTTSSEALPAVARLIERELRLAVADAADRNASVTIPQAAAGIDRLMTRAIIENVVGLVDRDALQDALLDGTCEVVDFRIHADDIGYFEGLSAQPGTSRPGFLHHAQFSLGKSCRPWPREEWFYSPVHRVWANLRCFGLPSIRAATSSGTESIA
jgi:hypothetical protein